MLEPHEEILPEDVSEEDAERILERIATEIVSRRLTAPAIFFGVLQPSELHWQSGDDSPGTFHSRNI